MRRKRIRRTLDGRHSHKEFMDMIGDEIIIRWMDGETIPEKIDNFDRLLKENKDPNALLTWDSNRINDKKLSEALENMSAREMESFKTYFKKHGFPKEYLY